MILIVCYSKEKNVNNFKFFSKFIRERRENILMENSFESSNIWHAIRYLSEIKRFDYIKRKLKYKMNMKNRIFGVT